jgi:hypothetical protein
MFSRRSRREAAGDPSTVSVVERHELVRDDARGLVDLLGGGGGVLVNEQPAQLAQAIEAPRALRAEHTNATQRREIAAR